MLLSRVHANIPTTPTTEDIFASASALLFTDDTQVSHGTPGHQVNYHSPRFGQIVLDIPVHPDVEEGRQLFAHYLWNSGVVAADAVESTSLGDDKVIDGEEDQSLRLSGGDKGRRVEWDRRYWDVSGEDVLELGAGTGLPSLIAALSHANSVTITDHPSSPSLTNDTIQRNVAHNLYTQIDSEAASTKLESQNRRSPKHDPQTSFDAEPSAPTTTTTTTTTIPLPNPRTPTQVNIAGHTWGTQTFTSPTHYGRLADPQPQPHTFSRILTTDCLWMPSQHANLCRTMLRYLKLPSQDESETVESTSVSGSGGGSTPCALVVAGFHTGRSTVASFFELATGSAWGANGLEPKSDTTNADMNTQTDHAQQQDQHPNSKQEQANRPATEEEEDEDSNSDVRARLRAASIFEIDVDCQRRSWMPERQGEDKHEAKRWCVCAVLVRA